MSASCPQLVRSLPLIHACAPTQRSWDMCVGRVGLWYAYEVDCHVRVEMGWDVGSESQAAICSCVIAWWSRGSVTMH